ncbi:calcium-binding protein [Rhodobacteraceae bacterium KMM 6894]|nr:calcium-binding protein [Rhodobacteraceae bacterium KMM 6894]
MTFLIGAAENRFNVFDSANPLTQLNGAGGVHVLTIGARTFAYMISRVDDAVTGFELFPDGQMLNVANVSDDDFPLLDFSRSAQSATVDGTTYLYVNGHLGLTVFQVAPDGTLSHVQDVMDDAVLMLDLSSGMMTTATVAGTQYLIASGFADNGISAFSIGADGSLTHSDSTSAFLVNPAIDGALDMASATVGGNTFVFVTGNTGDGVSSYRLNTDGTLTFVQGVLDTALLQLNGAWGVATAAVGTSTYLFVGGNIDDGISVFEIDSTGILTSVFFIDSGTVPSLDNVIGLTTFTIEGQTFLSASAQTSDAVTLFHVTNAGGLIEVDVINDTAATQLGATLYNDFYMMGERPFLAATGWLDDGLSTFELGGGDDTIIGTAGPDTILGLGGDDSISAGGQDDLVYDGRGNDSVNLGSGDDTLIVGGGADVYDGGSGDDYIDYSASSGGVNINLTTNVISGSWANNDVIEDFEGVGGSLTGNDTIRGTNGDNTINGHGGDDRVYALDGNDDIDLGAGDDYLRAASGANFYDGGSGDDYISYYDSIVGLTLDLESTYGSVAGWGGDDTIVGFEGASGSNTQDDFILGTGGDNTIRGYGGNDTVFDRGGADLIQLGAGNDFVVAGGGQDSYEGGSGDDFLSYFDSSGGVDVDLAADSATGSWANNDVIEDFEAVAGSGTGDDTLSGTSGDNTLVGNGGDDRVFDRGGNDSVNLGAGDDYVRAGGGADTYLGGAGDDYISYYDSSNGVDLDFAADTATGSWANNDIVIGFEGASGSNTGNDTLRGTDGESVLRGYGGNDRLHGRGGDDSMVGGSGADSLYGGSGADTMRGGSGDDYLDGGGGSGTDLLYGNSGADEFHFDRGEGDDVIMDFENNVDVIQFDNFSGFTTAADALSFATQTGGDVFFDFGADGTLLVENATIAQLGNDIDIV